MSLLLFPQVEVLRKYLLCQDCISTRENYSVSHSRPWLFRISLIFLPACGAFLPGAPQNAAGNASKTELVTHSSPPKPAHFPVCLVLVLIALGQKLSYYILFFFSYCSYSWFVGLIDSVLETSTKMSLSSPPSQFLCWDGPHCLLIGSWQQTVPYTTSF